LDELDSILDLISEETTISQPSYILSGSGFGWFYDSAHRQMVRVRRGSECILFDEDPSDTNKFLVEVENKILSISKDEILELGWN
tara:strand:- start:374 stop:628 length:255 start_codon:yes stop_codon:yes gene_type:complete